MASSTPPSPPFSHTSERANSQPLSWQKSLTKFSLAVNYGEEANFFDCKVFGQDNVVSYLHQGDKIAITGRLVQEKFDRKDGTKGSAVVILVNNIEFADVLTGEEPEQEIVDAPKETTVEKPKTVVKPVANPRRTR